MKTLLIHNCSFVTETDRAGHMVKTVQQVGDTTKTEVITSTGNT